MLDSEPTNDNGTGDTDHTMTGGASPTDPTGPTDAPTAARKRASRKATKKAAPKAPASNEPSVADQTLTPSQTTSVDAAAAGAVPADSASAVPADSASAVPADSASAVPADSASAVPADSASAVPAKATRRRRATSPAGGPTQATQLPLVDGGGPGQPTAAEPAPATRSRRRATKAAASPAPSPDAATASSGDDPAGDNPASTSDAPSSHALIDQPVSNDTRTDSTASVDATETGAAAPSTRRRSQAAAASPFDSASPDAEPRAPRKRGGRKAAAAVEPAAVEPVAVESVAVEPVADGAGWGSELDADHEAVLAAALALADATIIDPHSGADDTSATPAARSAIPVLFVAPGAAEQEAAPAPRRRRRATSAATAPFSSAETATDPHETETFPTAGHDDSDAAEDGLTPDALTPDDEGGTDPDATSGGEDDGRRRRRRGRRGRGARADETPDAAEDDTSSEPNDEADGTGDDGVVDEGDDGTADDAGGSGSRRRRRRRRGSSGEGNGADSSSDDPPNTVVHVRTRGEREPREPRSTRAASAGSSSDDEVRGIRGSSRLEAKRQRRRDGRDNGRRRVPILTEAEFLARRESVDRLMAVRQRGDRTQIAILEDGVLVEHYVTRASATSYVGNVYLGRVQNVLPSMEAAFVDIGKGRNGVLYAGEVNWDAAGLEGKARAIEAAMKPGDAVLVQVTKDPIGHKGARLTSQISLPGRFLVLVPNGGMTGISRKLPDNERHRLKAILKKIVPEDAGVIVRTAAEGASEEDLTSDIDRLKSQWEAISAHAAKPGDAPVLVHGEPDLAIRVVRDVFNEDFQSMVVEGDGDGESAWDEIAGYLGAVAPELAARARRHTGETDLFHELRVDEQLAKALDRKVWLPSGGSLVIDRTEAMVVVDVNTGKFTGSGGNLEQTVTRNNLEAAEEIVRQLRLRDVGGIIVIDFIDMVLESNRDLVLRRLTECLGRDRTKHQVAEVTSLGLVQMTRKRVGEGLLEAFSEPCDKCHGRGVIVHSEPIDQPHKHDIDDGPTRGSGNGNGSSGNGSGNGSAGRASAGNGGGGNGSGGSGNGSTRRNRRGRGGQRDDVAIVEEHEDDPDRRARAAAAMNAIARHTLSLEAQAAVHADLDLMPGGALDPDAVYAADSDASDTDAVALDAFEPATSDQDPGADGEQVGLAQLGDEIEAALAELPINLIDAALDASDADSEASVTADSSTDFDPPVEPYVRPQSVSDDPESDERPSDEPESGDLESDEPESGSTEPEPVPLEGGETADETDANPLPAQAQADNAPTASEAHGRPRRRRAARRPAGPPAHV